MFLTRQFLNFEAFLGGDFADLRVNCTNPDGSEQHFYTHRVIMAASSDYFKGALKAGDDKKYPDSLDVPVSGIHFEAFLKLIYEGHIVMGEIESVGFIATLREVLQLNCLEKESKKRKSESSIGQDEKAKKPKIKKEPGVKADPDEAEENDGENDEEEEEKKPTLAIFSFQDINESNIHKFVKVNPDTKKSTCTLCGTQCSSSQNVKDHIRSAHRKIKDIPCPHCDQLFLTLNSQFKHITKLHKEQRILAKALQQK